MHSKMTMEDVKSLAYFREGDVLTTQKGDKGVVVQIFCSITHEEIYYRINWQDDDREELIPQKALGAIRATGKQSRPYGWSE